MKKLILLLLALPFVVSAQIYDPVTWSFTQEQISPDEIELKFTADIEEGWYLYSQTIEDDGPVPTSFIFFESDSFQLVGPTTEGTPIEQFDPNFDMVLSYFKKDAVFTQRIKVNTNNDFTLKGELTFMACDVSKCLPPEYVEFEFDVKGSSSSTNNDG